MDVNFFIFILELLSLCDVIWIFVHKLDLYFYIYILRIV